MAERQSTATEIEAGMALGLEIALEYIDLKNMIDDDLTLRNARLVCHTWRTSKTFSSKVKSATLHTLADVKLAASLLSSTPAQHFPSRSVKGSSVFPNLTTLYLSEYLVSELGKSYCFLHFVALIKNIDIQVLEVKAYSWNSQKMLALRRLAGIGCSLQLNWCEMMELEFVEEDSFLAHVTKLALPGVYRIASCSFLSRLSSLRHLYLPIELFDQSPDLDTLLSVCSGLTQLTRLDFVDEGSEVGDMQRIANHFAPEPVRAFLGLHVPDFAHTFDFDWNIFTTFSHGLLVAKQLDCRVRIYRPRCDTENQQRVSSVLSEVLKYGISAYELSICVQHRFNEDNADCRDTLLIDLEFGSPKRQEGAFDSVSNGSLPFKRTFSISFEGSEPAHVESCTNHPVVANCGGPTLAEILNAPFSAASQKDVQISPLFALKSWQLSIAEVTDIQDRLPTLYPELRELALFIGSGSIMFVKQISHLTKLTSLILSLRPKNPSYASLPPLTLPPSVQMLSVRVHNLEYLALTNLEHVKKLVVNGYNTDGTVDALFLLHAPTLEVLDLCCCDFRPSLQIDLGRIALTFPLLEFLSVRPNSYDLSPLASLHRLRTLDICLPEQDTGVLTGIETLTSLAYLEIRSTNECLESISALLGLTYLKSLKHDIRPNNSMAGKTDSELALAEEMCKARMLQAYRELKQQFRLHMPHTRVEITILGREVDSFWASFD